MKNYSIGLDIGTESVGFAVIDEDCKLIKKSGKNLFGVREFRKGEDAVKTRVSRVNRRRLQRRRTRINHLRDLVREDINKIDDKFFDRMNDSFYLEEDKKYSSNKNILFNDKEFKDINYFNKYKTIYHLRKELLENDDKKDIRLVYLALHHIIKYRGHFLIDGEIDAKNNFEKEVKNLFLEMYSYYGFGNDDSTEADELSKIVVDNINKKSSKKDKTTNIKDYLKSLGKDKEDLKKFETIISLIFGYKADFKNLYSEMEESKTIKLSSEDDVAEIEGIIGEDYYVFEYIKNTYSSIILKDILNDETFLSVAMIKKYEKHKTDLILLKNLYDEFLSKDKKVLMFRDTDAKHKNYYNYINSPKNCNYEDFGKKIMSDFKGIKDERLERIFLELDESEFLQKQRTIYNINIPNQLHYNELKIILNNQRKYHDSIDKNYEKILNIFSFRIPYYVGPLNGNAKAYENGKRQFNWAVRKKDDVKITPWNFHEIIDEDASAEAFIERMRNKCSYLLTEETLPMNSIYISKFNVLNELNKIKVNDKPLDINDKKEIYKQLFLKNRSVNKKAFDEAYKKITSKEVLKSEGYQKENAFASSMASYYDFRKILGEVNENNIEMIEKIIFWLTIFNDKKMIYRKIKNQYGEVIDDKDIDKISSLKYSGWSRLSKKLIDGIYTEENGQQKTILDIMENHLDNLNFMQIINSKEYTFKKQIEEYKNTEKEDLTIDDINELQTSPSTKKGIWQSVQVIKELEQIMGCAPRSVFIEFARDLDNKNKKKRTDSRDKFLRNQYKVLIKDSTESSVAKDNNKLITKDNVSDEMKYLYLLQNGKCLYTGEPLDIDRLSYTCHVDHIIPRSLVKDNSIENKALVLAKENMEKKDGKTLGIETINKQRTFWTTLFNAKLMGKKKLYNLTRERYSEKDIEGFIARQLVETRQITMHTKNLLENYYDSKNTGTKVYAIKAGLASIFRRETELYKIRDLSSHHHAHDAYLCATIGLFMNKRFDYLNNLSESIKYKDVLTNKGNYIIASFLNKEVIDKRTGEILWENGNEKVEYMRKIFNYHDLLYSKKTEEVSGSFYDITIKKKNSGKIPVNKNTKGKTDKYGGYTGQKMNSFLIIRFASGKKEITRIIGIPIEKKSLIRNGMLTEEAFVQEYLGKNEPEAKKDSIEILKRFNKYQQIEYKGEQFLFASVQEGDSLATLHIATDLTLSDKHKKTLYGICNKKVIDRHQKETGKTIYSNITFDDVLDLLDVIIDKSDKYYKIYKSQFKKVKSIDYKSLKRTQENKEKIEELIILLLKGLKRGTASEKVDFKFDEFKLTFSDYGRLRKSFKEIKDDVKLTTKSVTGFYQNVEVIKYEL